MDDAGPDPEMENAGGDDGDQAGKLGLTLEAYARDLALPLAWLRDNGLSTIDNPWVSDRTAVAIPYRRRDGTLFRYRIRQAVSPSGTAHSRTVWDRRPEKLGALVYGLDQLPAIGCPLLLVDDEAACHLLWHHGFDAIATQGEGGYVVKRDDPELEGFLITVIGPVAESLLTRLLRSKHRRRITVAALNGFADLIALHRSAAHRFVDVVRAAIAAAQPLTKVAPMVANPKPGRPHERRRRRLAGRHDRRQSGYARPSAWQFLHGR